MRASMTANSLSSPLRFKSLYHVPLPFDEANQEQHNQFAGQIVNALESEIGKDKVYSRILPQSKGVAFATYDKHDEVAREIVWDAFRFLMVNAVFQTGKTMVGAGQINYHGDFKVETKDDFSRAKTYIDDQYKKFFPDGQKLVLPDEKPKPKGLIAWLKGLRFPWSK